AESRRTGEQHVVERLAACAGGLDEDAELGLDLLLADEIGQQLRPQRAVELLLGPALDLRCLQALDARCADPAHRTAFNAAPIRSSAESPSMSSSIESASGGV